MPSSIYSLYFWAISKYTSCLPEKFNFNAGEYKDHELVIAVSNCFNKVFFPYFDFYAYGGIFGSVKIEELPAYRIDLTKVTTLDYTTGRISVDVEVNKFFRKAKNIRKIKSPRTEVRGLSLFNKQCY